jgi:iduronate 2-sulfatase
MRALLLTAFGSLGVAAVQDAAPEGKKPNILLLCVDDLKPAIGCYGDALARTPNVDRLARRGVRFERAFCNQAVCSPSRNALLTGLRPQTLGIYDLATNFRKARPDAVTLPQQFRKHGYRTEAMGKIFHVGHGNHEDPASWSVPHFAAKTVAYALKENLGPTREGALFDNKNPKDLPRGAPTESADVPDETYGDGRIAAEAVRRLREAKQNPDSPFFMAVGFLKPHLPFVAPRKYWDLHDPAKLPQPGRASPPEGAPPFAPQFGGELRQYKDVPDKGPMGAELTRHLIHGYYAATSYMDAQLGKVLDALEETGLHRNTIVVLWGDHGWHLGDHGMWCKHTNYEQAARIPLIVEVPGGRQDAAARALVETVDLYPTLCRLAGIPVPDGLDGTGFEKVLADPQAAHRESVIHVYPRGQRLGRALRTERHRLVEWKVPGAAADSAVLELYDYQADPAETKNLAAEQPEVVARLRAALAAHPEALRPWTPAPK